MKRVITLLDLDCAVCADKMEKAVRKINGVRSVSVNFLTQKMTVDVDDSRKEQIFTEIKSTCKSVEPDCTLKL